MSAQFVAGWHQPGYMPEVPPVVFDSFSDAHAHILAEVERMWDEDYDGEAGKGTDLVTDDEARGLVDAKWLPVHTTLHAVQDAPFGEYTGDHSLYVWIERYWPPDPWVTSAPRRKPCTGPPTRRRCGHE